jgi:putative YphP/YqiW family bacilliredoxin
MDILEGQSIMQTHRYDPAMVQPMREELTRLGFNEMLTPEDVDSALAGSEGTTLVVVNSVCGCAAGSARPAVRLALEQEPRPDRLATVFAGMELGAVERTRSYFPGYPPSSPQIALIKDGKLAYMMERQDIEGRHAETLAADLRTIFDKFCR